MAATASSGFLRPTASRRPDREHARLRAQAPAWQDTLLTIAQAVVDELPAVHDAEWDYARG